VQSAGNSGKPLGGRGSALNPAGGAYSAPPDPVADGREGVAVPSQEPHPHSRPSVFPIEKSWTHPKKNTALLHMRIEEVLMCIRQTIMITDLMLLT